MSDVTGTGAAGGSDMHVQRGRPPERTSSSTPRAPRPISPDTLAHIKKNSQDIFGEAAPMSMESDAFTNPSNQTATATIKGIFSGAAGGLAGHFAGVAMSSSLGLGASGGMVGKLASSLLPSAMAATGAMGDAGAISGLSMDALQDVFSNTKDKPVNEAVYTIGLMLQRDGKSSDAIREKVSDDIRELHAPELTPLVRDFVDKLADDDHATQGFGLESLFLATSAEVKNLLSQPEHQAAFQDAMSTGDTKKLDSIMEQASSNLNEKLGWTGIKEKEDMRAYARGEEPSALVTPDYVKEVFKNLTGGALLYLQRNG